LEEIDSKTLLTVFASMFTIFISLFGIVYTQKQIKLREIAEAHRHKKIEVYNKFITISTNMIAAENEKHSIKPYSENELIEAIFDFKRDILLWGSPKVVKSVIKFQDDSETNNIIIAINSIYVAMREDIGLDNKELKNLELIKIFITDPKEIENYLK
jgi:low temperature requirement protein LtrA